MAQPTRSDDQVVRRRLSHNNLRRKKWRRRLPRAERKRPRRSGKFSALTFGVLVEHPIFLSRVFFSISRKLLLARRVTTRTGQPTKRDRRNAGPTCQAAECAGGRAIPQSTSEGRASLNGEEGSQGRKEEGGEEEVAEPSWERRGRQGAPFSFGAATACSPRPRSGSAG